MKITIELSDAEVAGIKSYLKEVDGIKPKKGDIKRLVMSFVNEIHNHNTALSELIRREELKTIQRAI